MKTETVMHFYDTKTRRPICGAKLTPGYPSNAIMETVYVTCPKCLAKLPKDNGTPI
jgi:hypothetical protein